MSEQPSEQPGLVEPVRPAPAVGFGEAFRVWLKIGLLRMFSMIRITLIPVKTARLPHANHRDERAVEDLPLAHRRAQPLSLVDLAPEHGDGAAGDPPCRLEGGRWRGVLARQTSRAQR